MSEDLAASGALCLPGLIADDLTAWLEVAGPYFQKGQPGVRIIGDPRLSDLVEQLAESRPLQDALGTGHWRCVRAIAFDKAPNSNWALGWHQDRTIAVKARHEVPGFKTWSSKQCILHVEPPFALIDRMRTLRLHFDPVDDSNGALLVASGSHLLGRVSDIEASNHAGRVTPLSCHANAGDGWLYATPILHASARSTSDQRRRVLQVDLSQDSLPAPLEWLGVA